ncbi:MAG: acetyltransferase [Lacrimispora sp.]|uniref:acetyltransferase n=1 Tax=Lacrimispora sp. TaxID=2719234 RepID=UPI0039E53C82
MKNVIIFGVNQFAEMLYYYLLKENEYKVCAFTVDNDYCDEENFLGLPVVAFENVQEFYSPDEYAIFICAGYKNMNNVRTFKFQQAREKGYKIMSYIHKTAIVLTDDFGEGNIVMEGVTIGVMCRIGDGNVFWANAHVAHHTIVGDYNFFTISVSVAGNIRIHNNCFFGNNCTIRNGLDIADYTLVGAGAYISKDTEKDSVYVPQRTIKLEGKKSIEMNL